MPRDGDLIINWGNSSCPYPLALNASVSEASNKLKFFYRMADSGLSDTVPKFWANKDNIDDEDFPIVCRTILSGHSGAGIHIAASRDDLCDAPLYVKYINKKDEYRVHVGKTKAGELVTISVQRKARRLSVPDEEVNWKVRNLAGGFVFVREGFTLPSACEEAAHSCLRATGLDFGAVDVIWNEQQQRAYVLEVNSAPGLEGQTVEDYATFFKEFV